ncbi:MAG: hypothetical protein JNL73_13370 [Anaerolineales bacterium]|nr:hypothetical protein [Anaerolineales bacterium]
MRFALSIVWAACLVACQPLAGPTPTVLLTPTAPRIAMPTTERSLSPTPSPNAVAPTVTPSATATVFGTPTSLPTADRLPDRVPATQAPEVGEAPADVLVAVSQAARTQLDLSAEAAIVVVRAEAVIWPDGALGCAEPGGIYTQAEVPGYWVEVEAAGKRLDYRVPDGGFPILCTRPGGLSIP